MTDSIRHRGPDDEGHHVQGSVALGMRRLSIIDVAGGHQPITNEDETMWIVFNGELYNFPELRPVLEKAGHHFRTRTDTEVVLHAYEQWGRDALKRFNGMFAFAIWDQRQKRLILARDHVGIKPLYYGRQGNVFLFGSELKALMRHHATTKTLNLRAFDHYLAAMYVPTPESILEGLRKLPPGHALEWECGSTRLHRYWDVQFHGSKTTQLSDDDAASLVLQAARESVRKELISDVPVGVLLSGGVDSSAVAAFMAPMMPNGLDSFSIGFDDPSFDESRYARQVAEHIGARHHALTVTPAMMLDALPDILGVLDEPLADASIVPSYLLAQFARRHVKVALGGDGGDELFAGYSTLQAHRLAEYYGRLPRLLRSHLVPSVVNRLPVSQSNLSFDYKAKRFVAAADLPPALRHHHWMGCFSLEEKKLLLTSDMTRQLDKAGTFSLLDSHLAQSDARSVLDQILYLDMKMYLEGDILVKVDRASMGCSLETRVPLLNRCLSEVVLQLPMHQKLRRFSRKHVFRRALKELLPPEILQRPKKGFGIPVARWLNKELKPLVEELFDERRIRREGYFNYTYIRRLIDDHATRKSDNRMQLWTLMTFQLWHKRYIEGAEDIVSVPSGIFSS
jgi:asparagine synthase (glutamine-hydrolysing)